MNESQRNALIASLIAETTKAERERKTSEYTDRYNVGQFYENERRFQGNIEQEGKWYFYNQSAMAFGRTEFRRRWGDRKLEDNWRRSNKARVSMTQFGGADDSGQEKADTSAAISNYKKPEYYLKDLPLNDSLMAISDDKISMALLNAGKAYSDRLLDQDRATETYESLLKRYPESELVPEALFNLYRINKEDNGARSEVYRQRLLQQYPESEYARILSDPAYYEKKLAEMKMAEKVYNEAYNAYNEERFNDAISLCDEAFRNIPRISWLPNFSCCMPMLWHGPAMKEVSGLNSDILIKTWPETAESKRQKK